MDQDEVRGRFTVKAWPGRVQRRGRSGLMLPGGRIGAALKGDGHGTAKGVAWEIRHRSLVVEGRGFEPPTSALRTPRAAPSGKPKGVPPGTGTRGRPPGAIAQPARTAGAESRPGSGNRGSPSVDWPLDARTGRPTGQAMTPPQRHGALREKRILQAEGRQEREEPEAEEAGPNRVAPKLGRAAKWTRMGFVVGLP